MSHFELLKNCNGKQRSVIHIAEACVGYRVGEDRIHCDFEEPVRAVTQGQAVTMMLG